VPESDEQASYRKVMLEEQEVEMKISKKRESEECEQFVDVKRPKLSAELPVRIISMIQSMPLVKMEPDQDISEYMKIEDTGMKETDVTSNALCAVEPVVNNDILFNCDFSAAVSKRMDIDDGTYSCFICQDTDPHSFNRASDLIRHSVSKPEQYPEQAKHNKPYLADETDLRAAKADEILRKL